MEDFNCDFVFVELIYTESNYVRTLKIVSRVRMTELVSRLYCLSFLLYWISDVHGNFY